MNRIERQLLGAAGRCANGPPLGLELAKDIDARTTLPYR
jgi:hypothetical protein